VSSDFTEVRKAITIGCDAHALYTRWRQLESLPQLFSHVKSVTVLGPTLSRWTVEGPAGSELTWDSEIVEDVPDRTIAWRSLQGAEVDSEGVVEFVPAPRGQGTEVHVRLRYHPPGGVLGRAVAALFHKNPAAQIGDDLRRLKQLVELGREPTILGQPAARAEEA